MIQQPRFVSVEEYLLLDNNSQERYEYLEGYPRLMVGGTSNHADLSGNMYMQLRLALGKRTPCRVYMADKRVKLANNKYAYPDVVVSCNVADHGKSVTIEAPHLVVETLSPNSTETYDRTRKLAYYQATPSVQEIVLISQHIQFVEVFRRPERGVQWLYQQYKPGEDITLESIDVTFPVAELYDGLAIPIEVEED